MNRWEARGVSLQGTFKQGQHWNIQGKAQWEARGEVSHYFLYG